MEMMRVADSARYDHQSYAVVLDQDGCADDSTVQHEKPKEKERERDHKVLLVLMLWAYLSWVCVAATSLPAQTPCFQRRNHNASKANCSQNEPTLKARRDQSTEFSHDKGQHPRHTKTGYVTVQAEQLSL